MMELDARKLKILAGIVKTYIATGEPVGSKFIAQMMEEAVSPATVRNDMAVLFDLGLLEQPHTSAGRIPSHLGLRVYLDQIMEIQPLTMKEKQEIEALFNLRSPDPDRLLEGAAKALAAYTGCAAISATLNHRSLLVHRIEIIPATQRTAVILLILSNGMVKNRVCRVEFTLTSKIVDFFQTFANGVLRGHSVGDISESFIHSVSLSLDEYTEIFTPLLFSIYDLCREVNAGPVYRSGTSNLLEYEELRRIANQLFRVINSREEVMEIIGRDRDYLRVSIGKENHKMELANSSVIISRYQIGEDSEGAIGLVGPIRIDYARLIPHLEYFSQMLGKLLSDTLDEQI